MPLSPTPDTTTPSAWVFTGCHSPTGWACAQAGHAHNRDIIAVGEPGPWEQDALRMGWTVVSVDLTLSDSVDKLARRLLGEQVRVFHPLVAMPTGHIIPSTARLLAALGRAQAPVSRFVLGGSACVWRKRAHRWSVGDGSALGAGLTGRGRAYRAAEILAQRAVEPALVRLRAAPLWDAPERGLARRLNRRWIPQPKGGRAVLDPLCLSDFAAAVAAAMHTPDVPAAVFGLPGPITYQANTLARANGAHIFAAPTRLSEALGAARVLGWDSDIALTMAWSLTLSGSGAARALNWEATTPPLPNLMHKK